MLLRSLPLMSRPHAAVEFSAWALMAIPMGVLSGGVAGVIVHPVFESGTPPWLLGLAVALVTGAGPVSNMTSAMWAHIARGKPKIRLITRLQVVFSACLLAAAAVPASPVGLALFVAVLLAAQILWCGIITTRAHLWRQNYARNARTAFAARNQAIVSLIHAGTGAATGWLVASQPARFRLILFVGALCALLSLLRVRGLRLRHQKRLLAQESRGLDTGFSLRNCLSVLTEDRLYRRYMTWMMVLGSGNLMFMAPLILVMTGPLAMNGSAQVWITAALPTLVSPFALFYWARHLAREHVIQFRARNSRWYATAVALFAAGSISGLVPLLWVGATVLGIGIAGGVLGWNLGHNDFASDERVADYVGLHVSLTGVRGLLAPLIGVGLYGMLESFAPGFGAWSLVVPAALTGLGSLGFQRFGRDFSRHQSESSVPAA